MGAGGDAVSGSDAGAGSAWKRLVIQVAVGVVVIGLVITMINLGLWQLRRHDDRLALRDQLADSLAQPALDISEIGDIGEIGSGSAADLEYRRVEAQGELWCSQAVLVRNRTLGGRPGYWVMAPLELGAGSGAGAGASSAVMVNLGWLPRELASGSICPAPTRTTLTGLLFLPRSGSNKECNSLSPICTFGQPDIAAMSAHFAGTGLSSGAQSSSDAPLSVRPDFYIQMESSAPPAAPQLSVLGAPEFSLGNHRSYAVQWFIFATIAAGGYPLMLWRNARRRRS